MTWIRKYSDLSGKEKRLFIEAVFFLFLSKVLIMILPFSRLIKLLKPKDHYANPYDSSKLPSIRLAVDRANRLAFWGNICIVQSFAARFMLQRRSIPSVLFLGLAFKNGNELIAHAWLKSESTCITPKGKKNFKDIFNI